MTISFEIKKFLIVNHYMCLIIYTLHVIEN